MRLRSLAVALVLFAARPAPPGHAAFRSIVLATTTSTEDSGLLDALLPDFTRATGIEVKVIAVGTGAALKMAAKGDADAALVHAPEAEAPLVATGDLVEGRLVMHNDFVIVGPPGDPAGVGGAADAAAAMAAIARQAVFVSRGDDSGTHKMELALWKKAGLEAASAKREETGQGMGATLAVADQRGAYTLTDRGTYLAQRKRLAITVVFAGDPVLLNVYHAYVVSPEKHLRVHAAEARALVRWLVSPDVQARIGEFRKQELGEPLFVPDAVAAAEAAGKRRQGARPDSELTPASAAHPR